ncbi:hypothetical protein V2J09_003055 [Rumex salicifolius]
MSAGVLDVLSLIPDAVEKMIMFPSTRGHHGDAGAPDNRGSFPHLAFPVDIVESSGDYTFLVDVPGHSKSDLQVTLEEERTLVIKSGGGKRKRDQETEEEGCKYLRLERRRLPLKLTRKFRLPEDADVSTVSAKCENGVLTVSVKKLPPAPKPKTKTVQISVS